MNAPILKLFVVFLVLFAALIGMTSYNSVIKAGEYRANERNSRPLIEEQRIHRGVIRARDGGVLARSLKGDDELYKRRYTADGRLFSHAIGYDFLRNGRAGLEREYNDELTGRRNELVSVFDELRGRQRVGDSLVTNLDAGGQRVALQALQGRKGSIVAIETATGKVRVMVSSPDYDPNELDTKPAAEAPLINRATQSGYPPGSTFKVVTAAAALDSGQFNPDTTVSGKSPIQVSGAPLQNFSNEQFGAIPLTTALTNSVNTVWAQVAEKLGRETIGEYMEKFGFGSDPPLDYPDSQMRPSGVFDIKKERFLPSDLEGGDVGRVGIGQERLSVTPLQMATVAATVANDGVRMKPHLADRVVDQDGRTVQRIEPEEAERVISASAANQLTEMMSNVVKEGTGVGAALEGIQVAGKTGTAERNIAQRINQPWFIGFAPLDQPRIAVAVTLEDVRGAQSQGGAVAAPIAKQVLQELLQ